MKKKIISIFLVLVLLQPLFYTTAIALTEEQQEYQDKIDEATEKKDQIEEEKDSVLGEISDLEDSIYQAEAEIEDLNNQISDLEENIENKEKDLERLEEEYKKNEKELEEKLVTIYEKGQITFLDVLLSSESLTDFISGMYMVQTLTEADNELLDSLEAESAEVEKAKKELEEDKQELNSAKKEVENKQASLQVTKAEKENMVESLSDEEKSLQADIEEYKAERERIDEEIRKQQESAGDIYDGSFDGVLGWPLSSNSYGYNIVTSGYGSRESPAAGASTFHRGIDLGVDIGTPVYASADGYVLSVMETGARGLFVLIKHADDLYTRYQHLDSSNVYEGQYVQRGDLIARSGNSGIGSGPHLHFEVLYQPYYTYEMDPLNCGLVDVPSNLIYY